MDINYILEVILFISTYIKLEININNLSLVILLKCQTVLIYLLP
jgi:hypothetical protein